MMTNDWLTHYDDTKKLEVEVVEHDAECLKVHYSATIRAEWPALFHSLPPGFCIYTGNN